MLSIRYVPISPLKRTTFPHLPIAFRELLFLQARCYSSSTSPSFSYRLSAAYSAKKQPLDLVRNSQFHNPATPPAAPISSGLSTAERKLLRPKSGQDAYFLSDINASKFVAFGVVDGVGGWEESGVDPANFSHTLCEYMTKFSAENSDSTPIRPRDLLSLAYEAVQADPDVFAGGSTACVATASPAGEIEVANLGDSGYAHFSPLRLTHLSIPQTHDFNTPFQLSKIPQRIARQLALFGHGHHAETPAEADIYAHDVSHGDVFVLATDGVWDNLAPEDMLRIISSEMVRRQAWILPDTKDGNRDGAVHVGATLESLATPKTATASNQVEAESEVSTANENVELSTVLARSIVREAKRASIDTRRDGPFAKEVKRRFPWENYRGGKVDDICCVVGIVLQDGL